MILEMKVPSPGESISEVEIANWLVQTGDYVEKDQEIAEVDSDKATLALPAEASGVIELLVEPGTTVAVGQVVAKIDTSAAAPAGGVLTARNSASVFLSARFSRISRRKTTTRRVRDQPVSRSSLSTPCQP